MRKQYNIQLELMAAGKKSTTVNYVVGDSKTMPLYIQLTEHGKPFEIPENSMIEMNFLNFNGNNFPRMGVITDRRNGGVLYEIDSADIAINGSMSGSVTVINGSRRLTWQKFTFNVDRSLSGGETPPEAEVPWFGQVMQEILRLEKMIFDLQGGGTIQPYTGSVCGKAICGSTIAGKVA